MTALESSIESKVVRWCKAHDVLTTKLSGPGHRGKPDRVFWLPGGCPVLIEFKAPGKKPTKLQRFWLDAFTELGYDVYLFDNAEDAIVELSALLMAYAH